MALGGGGPEWFHAKRYGYGTSVPRTWQGWLLLVAYLAIVFAAGYFLGERQNNLAAMFAIVIPATLLFLLIVAKTTKGGWKWRFGKDKDTW